MSGLRLFLDDSSLEGTSSRDVGQTERDSNNDHEPTLEADDVNVEIVEINPKYKIGEPSEDLDIRSSVAYSYNYFTPMEINGVPHALCRLCEEEEKNTRNQTRVKPKGLKKSKHLKTVGGSTKGKSELQACIHRTFLQGGGAGGWGNIRTSACFLL